jgi:hypothetical protein
MAQVLLSTSQDEPKSNVAGAKPRRPTMKKILHNIQKNMMAATFAEAGEWDTAREMLPERKLSRELSWLNRVFMAITFAEANLQKEAVGFMAPVGGRRSDFNAVIYENLGLKGVQVIYGTVLI